jgi:hypothetical protein
VGRKHRLPITVSQYEDKNEYQRQWRELNPDYQKGRDPKKRREAAWKRKYGISGEDYEAFLKSQNGVCAICSTHNVGGRHKFFHVDHNHKTRKVRGLLCSNCNRGLGLFKDDPKVLKKAIEYLNKSNNAST